MNWISIINSVIPFSANGEHQKIQLNGDEIYFSDAGLDSLDVAVIGIYLCELLQVPNYLHKEIPAQSIKDLVNFLDENSINRDITPELISEMLK